MKVIYAIYFILAGFFITPNASASLILDVQGGQLVGINNFSFNGGLFEIEFADGSCLDLFDGCDDVDDFGAFSSGVNALDFVGTLVSFIANLTEVDNFTTTSGVTVDASSLTLANFYNGCEASPCLIAFPASPNLTGDDPFRRSRNLPVLIINNSAQPSLTTGALASIESDFRNSQSLAFARVTTQMSALDPVPAPEPSMISLLALGLLGIAVCRKRAL